MNRRYYIPDYSRSNDEAKCKDAAYRELEDLAFNMIQVMDDNDIDIFEYRVSSPQRKRDFNIMAEIKKDLD